MGQFGKWLGTSVRGFASLRNECGNAVREKSAIDKNTKELGLIRTILWNHI